ncbi:hypothetical protein, partial [Pseudomonas protegens]|uniref:hypothetical protein n=1 Tax=Pseudomonas protegens TaxID=380021 RepID=UPI001B3362DD
MEILSAVIDNDNHYSISARRLSAFTSIALIRPVQGHHEKRPTVASGVFACNGELEGSVRRVHQDRRSGHFRGL